jgi:single-stranded DNA-binding protein
VGDGDVFRRRRCEIAPKVEKGSGVYAEGTIKLDAWEKHDGTKSSSLTVMPMRCHSTETGKNQSKCERKPGS